jgi:hypothetical protein
VRNPYSTPTCCSLELAQGALVVYDLAPCLRGARPCTAVEPYSNAREAVAWVSVKTFFVSECRVVDAVERLR